MELQENISPSKAALNSGLIIGLVMVTLTFIIYFINYTFLVAAWYGFAVFALFLGWSSTLVYNTVKTLEDL